MLRIAIVENDDEDLTLLKKLLSQYSKTKDIKIKIDCFRDGIDFISDYNQVYDCVFLDIVMKMMSGKETAFKLRAIDKDIPIIFITKMAQYAIDGYKVQAYDFLLKPIQYEELVYNLDKIVKNKKTLDKKTLFFNYNGLMKKILFDDIYYIDIFEHQICIHTEDKMYSFRGTLKNIEEQLNASFARCNNCYIVNINYIDEVQDNTISLINGEKLRISRPRKKDFLDKFSQYIGSNVTK